MVPAFIFIAFLIAQRLVELVHAKRNTARLLERGAHEVAGDHYKYIVAVHTLWIIAIVFFGYDQPIHVGFLIAYIILQVFRVWILASLGSRWTTRIIILNEPLVARGPYKFIKHPNYVLVVFEIFIAPMVLGLIWVALAFSLLNAAILFVRIKAENRALATISV